MEYRRLGGTGLEVSVVGFGGLPLMQMAAPEARILVAGALASGINFFDTGCGYGESEVRIGAAVAESRDRVILATKAPSLTARGARQHVARACQRLGVETVDIFQLEGVNRPERLDAVLAPGGSLEGLLAARDAGRIRHIGITSHNCALLAEAIQRSPDLETVQFPFNILEDGREVRQLLEVAAERHVGTIVMKPLAGGVLPQPTQALRWLLSQPIHTAAVGMVSAEEVTANARVGDHPEPLTSAEEAHLRSLAEALGKRFCRRCMHCLPCPQGVPIYDIIELGQKVRLPQVAHLMRDIYEALPVKADACAECGECEDRCPYDLPIIEMLRQAHAMLTD